MNSGKCRFTLSRAHGLQPVGFECGVFNTRMSAHNQ
jgi:hypothetical protein